MKVVRFSVIHRPGATAATSAGPESAAVICAVVIVRQRGPPGTSNHWNEGVGGREGAVEHNQGSQADFCTNNNSNITSSRRESD